MHLFGYTGCISTPFSFVTALRDRTCVLISIQSGASAQYEFQCGVASQGTTLTQSLVCSPSTYPAKILAPDWPGAEEGLLYMRTYVRTLWCADVPSDESVIDVSDDEQVDLLQSAAPTLSFFVPRQD